MDRQAFLNACSRIVGNKRDKKGIGTLSEKTMHAVLKEYYQPFSDSQEVKVGNFVADIISESGIIEIQTRAFHRLTKKLDCFLEFCTVTVVTALPAVKYLSWLDTETGECTNRRKSPYKATIYDAVHELYSIKYTLDNPRMHLRLLLLEVEDIRYLNGWSKNKKRGSSRCDRIPIDIIDEVEFNCIDDYRKFLPQNLPEEFTSKDFSKCAKIHRNTAQTTLNILTYLGIVKRIGKSGNSIIYKVND